MYLLFDIGGTNMRVARTSDGKAFDGEPVVEKTPQDFEEFLELFTATAQRVTGGEKPACAVGGMAGVFDVHKRELVRSPNRMRWVGEPIADRLEAILNTDVYLENDAALVGLGEAHFGAGKGSEIVVYITVSTGVGGVRIVHGKIDANRYGFEPGHQIIDMDGTACPSCNAPGIHGDGPGHLEGYISGIATERRFGKKPYEVGDPEVWEMLADWLAVGLANTIVHWSPDVVVLGGPMVIGKPSIDIHEVRRNLEERIDIFPELPTLKEAALDKLGGLYGAMVAAQQMQKHQV